MHLVAVHGKWVGTYACDNSLEYIIHQHPRADYSARGWFLYWPAAVSGGLVSWGQ